MRYSMVPDMGWKMRFRKWYAIEKWYFGDHACHKKTTATRREVSLPMSFQVLEKKSGEKRRSYVRSTAKEPVRFNKIYIVFSVSLALCVSVFQQVTSVKVSIGQSAIVKVSTSKSTVDKVLTSMIFEEIMMDPMN